MCIRDRFYITEPEAKAEEFVHGVYGSTGDNLHAVRSEGPEIRRNIVPVSYTHLDGEGAPPRLHAG